MSEVEIAGMDNLLEALHHYEFKSEADIEDELLRCFEGQNPR